MLETTLKPGTLNFSQLAGLKYTSPKLIRYLRGLPKPPAHIVQVVALVGLGGGIWASAVCAGFNYKGLIWFLDSRKDKLQGASELITDKIVNGPYDGTPAVEYRRLLKLIEEEFTNPVIGRRHVPFVYACEAYALYRSAVPDDSPSFRCSEAQDFIKNVFDLEQELNHEWFK